MNETSNQSLITIRRRGDGVIDHGLPVSTLEPLAAERGQMQVPLVTTMMSCYERVRLCDFLREEGRLKFFCRREAQITSREVSRCPPPVVECIVSCLDDLFGVEVSWPTQLKAGERYRFLFVGAKPAGGTLEKDAEVDDSQMPDRVLINGRLAWTRSPGRTLAFAIDYVPEKDEFPVLTFVKDRAFTLRSNPSRFFPNTTPPHHPILRLFTYLSLDLALVCEHHGGRHSSTRLPEHPLPGDFRRFLSPGPFAFPQDFDPPEWTEPPLEPPPYPTDTLYIHDVADHYQNQNLIDPFPERMAQQNRLCLENGIYLLDPEQADWLEAQGLTHDDRLAFLIQSYLIRAHPNDEAAIQADIRAKHELALSLLTRFPNARVFVRLVEYSGCQYHSAGLMPSMRSRLVRGDAPLDWIDYANAADGIYREIHEAAFGEARRVGKDRFAIFANIQGLNFLSARAFRGGADFTMDKTIGRESVNLIVASSRGHNMAYGSPWIGMQHDNWGGLRFNYDGVVETTFVWRAFFFGGANVMDRETEYVGVRNGKVVPNRKGQAFLRVVRWMNRHPRRGRPRVKIAYMRGSDSLAGWSYPLGPDKANPDMYGADPYRPKEYADWNLLSVAFPGVLSDCRRNDRRWMTGTPYGPCDIIPWDTPAERLAEYGVVVMIGEHIFESDDQIENIAKAVRSGLTWVCSLSAFYGNRWKGEMYRRRDLTHPAGVELGPDVPLWVMQTTLDNVTNVSRHYNRVILKGASVLARLPNGDPWIVERRLGKGRVILFTTDRLTDFGYEPAARRIREWFAAHAPIVFEERPSGVGELGLFEPLHIPQLSESERITYAGTQPVEGFRVDQTPAAREGRTSWLDVSVFEKGPLRLIAIQDYGRARVPTDNSPDLGPWTGRVSINLTNLGLSPSEDLEILGMDESFTVRPMVWTHRDGMAECTLTIDGFTELAIGPAGRTRELLFR